MVYFDASAQAQARVRLAVGLADRFQAALIGIAGPPYLPAVSANVTDALAEIERKFRDAARPIRNVEWRGRAIWAGILVPQEARAADLVIVGPPPPGSARPFLFAPSGRDHSRCRTAGPVRTRRGR